MAAHQFNTREEWLGFVTAKLRPHYAKCGYAVPDKVRFAIGFMATGYRSKAIGECWDAKVSGDKHAEIWIAPSQDNPEKVACILAHELVHAVLGSAVGHKRPFANACKALGFEGKPRFALPGPAMVRDIIKPILDKAGKLPHKKLTAMGPKKKAGTRLLKAECPTCGYAVRVTKKWLDEAGAPFCGTKSHGRMACDAPDDDEGEE